MSFRMVVVNHIAKFAKLILYYFFFLKIDFLVFFLSKFVIYQLVKSFMNLFIFVLKLSNSIFCLYFFHD